jgi:hypothetical protein
VKINEYVELLAGKDEDLVEWENKYTGLYTAYEELYSNYNLTKSEYEVTITNIKVYESKYLPPYADCSSSRKIFQPSARPSETPSDSSNAMKIKTTSSR